MTPLRLLREARDIPGIQVAQAVNIDISHYYKIERGETSAGRELAKRISTFFDGAITRDEILYPEDYPCAGPGSSTGEAA